MGPICCPESVLEKTTVSPVTGRALASRIVAVAVNVLAPSATTVDCENARDMPVAGGIRKVSLMNGAS